MFGNITMKRNILLMVTSVVLVACGGGGGKASDGGFQQPIKPELNVSFEPGAILPNPTGTGYEGLSDDARARFTIYARQGGTPIENGNEELKLSINNAIGSVRGRIYCFELGNDACTTTITDSEGNQRQVLQPLHTVQLDLAAGRGSFAVTAANGEVGEIGLNITVEGPNNSRISKDVLIPVKYASSGEPYQINIIGANTIRPNSAVNVAVAITDEAGNPVNNSTANNLLITAKNLPGTVLGFKGSTGASISAKTDNGIASFTVLAPTNGFLTLIAQGDGADNNIDNGFQNLITTAKTIQVTDAYTPPTQNIAITTGKLPNGIVGVDYGRFNIATTGSVPINFVLTSGSLPPGITFSGGVLSGTPTVAGEYKFTVTATGANSSTAKQELTLKVIKGGFKFNRLAFDSIETTRNEDPKTPDVCWVGAQTLSLEPSADYILKTPFTWRMDAGGVSTALGPKNKAVRVVTANGIPLPELDFTVTDDTTQVVLNGKVCPTAPSNVFNGHAIILSATDANNFEFESVLPLVITRAVNTYTPPEPEKPEEPTPPENLTLTNAKVGVAYTVSVPNAASMTGAPTWLTLTGSILSGTPTVAGTFNFVVTLSNGQNQNVALTVEP